MMSSRLTRRLTRCTSEREGGFALITAMFTITLLAGLSLIALQQTITNGNLSKRDQDWVAALGAAQAGLDDYLSRMNDSDGAYFEWNSGRPDPNNPAMGTVDGQPRWAPVPTAGGATVRGRFHYEVDTRSYVGAASTTPNGNIVVEASGRVGSKTRTLRSVVRRAGFVDFVYLTDYETQDPTAFRAEFPAGSVEENCGNYYQLRSDACVNIQFSNDTLTGPVHSNDRMLICDNVTFNDRVTTWANPSSGRAYRTNDCTATSGTTFRRTADPLTVDKVNFPATNGSLKAETSASQVPRGCLYAGPTKIEVKGNQIKVTSPWTRTVTPGCQKGTYFTIPVSGVIYVESAYEGTDTTQPNYWPVGDVNKPVCPGGLQTRNNVGYPAAAHVGKDLWKYSCKAGDVFIEQEGGLFANALSGRMTVAAQNNVYVTNHLEYATGTSGNAFLGLVAENFVYVWHPVDQSVSPAVNLPLPGQSTPFMNARINAAMLSVLHSVGVMNYSRGASLGTLNITGTLTQRYRGVVRQNTSGYAKNYLYDQRLRYDSPPRFLEPTISSFGSVRTAEAPPAY